MSTVCTQIIPCLWSHASVDKPLKCSSLGLSPFAEDYALFILLLSFLLHQHLPVPEY